MPSSFHRHGLWYVGRRCNSDDANLPVDLGGTLLVERPVGWPAVRAAPLVLGNVVEHLFGLRPSSPAGHGRCWRAPTPAAAPGAFGPLRIWRLPGRVSPGILGLVLLLSLLLRRGADESVESVAIFSVVGRS